MMNVRLQQKILAQHRKDTDSDCWLWSGQISNSGYGKMMIKDESTNQTRMESAPEVSYMAFVGEVPSGMIARQTCGNRLCVNPDHLELFDTNGWKKTFAI